MGGEQICQLIDGATYLFTNEYEAALAEQKTGWSSADILRRVDVRVTTLGAKGVQVQRKGEPDVFVGCAAENEKADPTGVGDAFRAGFLTGVAWGLSHERAAQTGAMLATYVIETVGTQEYDFSPGDFLSRFTAAYGEQAAAEVESHLPTRRR
jgi:adenosine kinase